MSGNTELKYDVDEFKEYMTSFDAKKDLVMLESHDHIVAYSHPEVLR